MYVCEMRVICHVMHCAQSFESSCIAMVQTDYLSLVLILIYVYYVNFFFFFSLCFSDVGPDGCRDSVYFSHTPLV